MQQILKEFEYRVNWGTLFGESYRNDEGESLEPYGGLFETFDDDLENLKSLILDSPDNAKFRNCWIESVIFGNPCPFYSHYNAS